MDDVDPFDFEDEANDGALTGAPSLRLGPGVYDAAAVPIDAYIADPCETPSLRSGDIVRMLRDRPAHVRALHPRLTDPSLQQYAIRKASKAMDLGSVIHSIVLGEGAKFCVINPGDYKTQSGKPAQTAAAKEVQEAIAQARAAGLIVLDPKMNTAAQRAAERLTAKLDDHFAEFGGWPLGVVENTLVWEEQTPFGPVLCRTRPDLLAVTQAIGGDLKSSATGLSDDGIQKNMSGGDGAMFIQAAHQRAGIIANFPELTDTLRNMHIFVETAPPFEPRIVWTSAEAMLSAEIRRRNGIVRFAECRARDEWPGWMPMTANLAGYVATRWGIEENAALDTEATS